MNKEQWVKLQEIYFDLHDLINNNYLDSIEIYGFDEFETLKEFIREQIIKLEPLTKNSGEGREVWNRRILTHLKEV